MKIREFTPEYRITRDATILELNLYAKEGNIKAIKDLITLKGGWNKLSRKQKDKTIQYMLGIDAGDF